MPLEVYVMFHQYPWTFGESLCDFKAVLTEAVTCASILTVVSFSAERQVEKSFSRHVFNLMQS